MPSWIEFHDSELMEAARSDLETSILLDAYVHRWDDLDRRSGTGWMQQVRLIVGKAVGHLPTLSGPTRIAGLHSFEELVVRFCVLDDDFGLPVNRRDQGMTGLLEALEELRGVALEIAEGSNVVRNVQHES